MTQEHKLLILSESSKDSEIDVGMHFATDITFPSKEDLIEWARNVAKGLGFVVVVQRADKVVGRPKPRIYLGCDRSGSPRVHLKRVTQNLRKSSSKRCGCPFSLLGQKDATDNEWKLEVKCGMHNHVFVHLEAHSVASRLNENEQKIVEEMYSSGVKPRKILSALKKRNPSNTSIMRTIYNEKMRLYRKELDGSTPIQFLYRCIRDAAYTSYNQVNPTNGALVSLFFAHPTSTQLSNMFPNVFIMDCTYKTNRYRLPLLSIVGLTSTNLTFFSAFAFMSNETESSYRWALECFKSSLDPSALPSVLIVDREIALMNAIQVVFPEARIILCQVHISRNILAHCKKYFKSGKECELFLSEWQCLVNSQTDHEYNTCFNLLLTKYSEKYPDVLHYVVSTWLEPYKEYFVTAWIDKLMHFGNTTTNRVESGHNHLKKNLEVSVCNLTSIWKTFDQMLNLQHTEIKRSFGQSSIQVNTGFRGSLYTELLGYVSIAALDLIKKEEELAKRGCVEATKCLHKMRNTMGLPCAHELVTYMNQSLAFPMWMVHKHWRQLILKACNATEIKKEDEPVDIIQMELDGLLQKYNTITDSQRHEMKRKLREVLDPTTTQTKEPRMPLKLKGRPRGSYKKFKDDYKSTKRELSHFEHVLLTEQHYQPKPKKLLPRRKAGADRFVECIRKEMPSYISNYIVDAINVIGDGHCGFRVVSKSLEMGENWLQVRRDLSNEMACFEFLYNNLFGNVRQAELLSSLDCTAATAPLDKWMTMPDMGLVIASCYNVAVVHYSKIQSFTFLPLHSSPPPSRKTIFIGFVNDNHFIQLLMREDCPLPPIITTWTRYHATIAEEWDLTYIPRIREDDDMIKVEETINLADP